MDRGAHVRIRAVERADAEQILALHLRSWRETYRGLMPDAFLDGPALPQRLRTWYVQMALPRENRLLAVAEHRERIAGFICVHALADRDFGSRVESLHVLAELQRLRAGTLLMLHGAQWLQSRGARAAGAGVYLWVMQRNMRARRFYDRLGGTEVARRERADPSGGNVLHCRYAWRAPIDLVRQCERHAPLAPPAQPDPVPGTQAASPPPAAPLPGTGPAVSPL